MKFLTIIFSVVMVIVVGIVSLSIYTSAKQEKEMYLLSEVMNIEQLEQNISFIQYSHYPTESIMIQKEEQSFMPIIRILESLKVTKAALIIQAPGVEGVTLSFEYGNKTQRIRFNEEGVIKIKDVIYVVKDEESLQQLSEVMALVHNE